MFQTRVSMTFRQRGPQIGPLTRGSSSMGAGILSAVVLACATVWGVDPVWAADTSTSAESIGKQPAWSPLPDAPVTRSVRREAVDRGLQFLESLMDSELELLPEFPGSKTYWLFHDNYLAAKVLRPTNPKMADRIEAALRFRGYTRSGKIEIVMGEAESPLPFRDYQLKDVARVGTKIIRTEVVLDRVNRGWEKYADLCFLAAMAEGDAGRRAAHFRAGVDMWDGRGFRDQATVVSGIYATYKLALALTAADRLGERGARKAAPLWNREWVERRLVAMQGAKGGWVTDYKPDGSPHGLMNVETTSLAILGLRGRPKGR